MLRRDETRARLVLGTAQLGMDYGVANRTGQPDSRSAGSIVAAALSGGVRMFDTAQAYGASEQVLSRILADLGCLQKISVFTKIAPTVDCSGFDSVRNAVEMSAGLFGPAFYCCMLHSEDQLDEWSSGLGEWLRALRDRGLFRHIGVSVYDPSAARRALESEGIDYVQIPANLLDRRHEAKGVMQLARELGKTIIIRSVFLQGAFLLPVHRLPETVKHLQPYLEPIAGVSAQHNIPMRDAALQFVRERWPEALVIFGAELTWQIEENLSAWDQPLPADAYEALVKMDAAVPLEVVRPDLWSAPDFLATGFRLHLRLVRLSDVRGNYLKWMNDLEITRFLESRFRSHQQADLEAYVLEQIADPSVCFLAVEEIGTGRHIGNVKIGPKNAFHQTAELGLVIGEKDCWGKGCATEAIALAVKIAFENCAVRKLVAGCYRNNRASKRAFLKNGFLVEGELREQVIDDAGNPSDVVMLGLLHDDWKNNSGLLPDRG